LPAILALGGSDRLTTGDESLTYLLVDGGHQESTEDVFRDSKLCLTFFEAN